MYTIRNSQTGRIVAYADCFAAASLIVERSKGKLCFDHAPRRPRPNTLAAATLAAGPL
jgi:hypothetical protein